MVSRQAAALVGRGLDAVRTGLPSEGSHPLIVATCVPWEESSTKSRTHMPAPFYMYSVVNRIWREAEERRSS